MLRESDSVLVPTPTGADASAPSRPFLVSFGISGWFDRFAAPEDLELCRADRVVVHTHRGVEFGSVLCAATRGHEHFLNDRPMGTLQRRMNEVDERDAAELNERAQQVFDSARRLTKELELPLDMLDVETLVEPRTFVLHYLGRADDVRPFVSQLSKQFDAYIELLNLAAELPPEEAAAACETCGSTEGGGCSSESGGGCGTDGGCGTSKKQMTPAEWQAYFAELRKHVKPGTV